MNCPRTGAPCGQSCYTHTYCALMPQTWQPLNTGWICPRCQKVNAPSVQQCSCPPLMQGAVTYGC